ncbi:MAG: hypothetical protein U9N33_12190 [Campylobacterota bacterium]|nr:hypothetical protein [Campylobacterota bacterium]
MLESVIDNREFTQLMQKHIEDLVVYFFESEQNFGILCKIEDVNFEPALPEMIVEEFRPMTLFFLAGYTFETAHLQDNYLIFEAGFGRDNFGSVVNVPLSSIMQIIIDETPVFINLSTYKEEDDHKDKTNPKGVENSMASFLSNPENSKFIKD